VKNVVTDANQTRSKSMKQGRLSFCYLHYFLS